MTDRPRDAALTGLDPAYRPCAGVMLMNRLGEVFVAQRVDTQGAWQMPQGGIDAGETPRAAAMRELQEEIGVGPDKATIVAEARDWLYYDLPGEVAGRLWDGAFRGQAQKWFVARFTGSDWDIDLNAHGSVEFSAWRWVSIDTLPGLIVPFKRPVYEALAAEFRHLAIPVTGVGGGLA